jgi:hypothetical protein
MYGEEAMKSPQVFFWVGEIRRRREYLSDEARQGRPFTVGLNESLAHHLER